MGREEEEGALLMTLLLLRMLLVMMVTSATGDCTSLAGPRRCRCGCRGYSTRPGALHCHRYCRGVIAQLGAVVGGAHVACELCVELVVGAVAQENLHFPLVQLCLCVRLEGVVGHKVSGC